MKLIVFTEAEIRDVVMAAGKLPAVLNDLMARHGVNDPVSFASFKRSLSAALKAAAATEAARASVRQALRRLGIEKGFVAPKEGKAPALPSLGKAVDRIQAAIAALDDSSARAKANRALAQIMQLLGIEAG